MRNWNWKLIAGIAIILGGAALIELIWPQQAGLLAPLYFLVAIGIGLLIGYWQNLGLVARHREDKNSKELLRNLDAGFRETEASKIITRKKMGPASQHERLKKIFDLLAETGLRPQVKNELAYGEMLALAESFEAWASDRRMTPEESAEFLGRAQNLRNVAEEVGSSWAPNPRSQRSVIAILAEQVTERPLTWDEAKSLLGSSADEKST